jgi:hypothetical protein
MIHHRPRTLFCLTVATIATAILTGVVGPQRGSLSVPRPFSAPVLALEFVDSPAQFKTLTEQPTTAVERAWLVDALCNLKRVLADYGCERTPWAAALFWRGTAADLAFIAAYGFLWLWMLKFVGAQRRVALPSLHDNVATAMAAHRSLWRRWAMRVSDRRRAVSIAIGNPRDPAGGRGRLRRGLGHHPRTAQRRSHPRACHPDRGGDQNGRRSASCFSALAERFPGDRGTQHSGCGAGVCGPRAPPGVARLQLVDRGFVPGGRRHRHRRRPRSSSLARVRVVAGRRGARAAADRVRMDGSHWRLRQPNPLDTRTTSARSVSASSTTTS